MLVERALHAAECGSHQIRTGNFLTTSGLNVRPVSGNNVHRYNHLSLTCRQSWCVSTDPEFSRKAADVVGLYLNPPEDGGFRYFVSIVGDQDSERKTLIAIASKLA